MRIGLVVANTVRVKVMRNYVYGPGRMQPDAAIEKYKERRVRDAQAPVGSTDFDDLAATDSDSYWYH